MKRLLEKKYRTPFILNICGIIFALLGWFLNELYLAGKLLGFGGSNLLLVGLILWSTGEVGLIRSLLKEQTD